MMNGPGVPFYNPMLLAEYQGGWIMRCIDRMNEHESRTIEPTQDAVDTWTSCHDSVTDMTLFPKGNSYYMGDNIPGKPRRSVYFWGGYPLYVRHCEAELAKAQSFRCAGSIDANVRTKGQTKTNIGHP